MLKIAGKAVEDIAGKAVGVVGDMKQVEVVAAVGRDHAVRLMAESSRSDLLRQSLTAHAANRSDVVVLAVVLTLAGNGRDNNIPVVAEGCCG